MKKPLLLRLREIPKGEDFKLPVIHPYFGISGSNCSG